MNAIEINNLSKSFHNVNAVDNLSLSVPEGAIYGFIGENGSGKSTTEKLICGLLVPTSGEIKLYGKDYNDPGVRARIGVLIENPGCFPNSTVYQNLFMQALNLNLPNPKEEVERVLKLVSMAGSADRKFRHCSLGMKQRIGIAQALLGNPKLLILDEPINGLDADGMRIVRDLLLDLTKNHGVTVFISSHILGELEKIATHYGIIRNGALIKELSAKEMTESCKSFVFVKTNNDDVALSILKGKYKNIEYKDNGYRIYDESETENVIKLLFDNNIMVKEISYKKIGLEEYYIQIMADKERK